MKLALLPLALVVLGLPSLASAQAKADADSKADAPSSAAAQPAPAPAPALPPALPPPTAAGAAGAGTPEAAPAADAPALPPPDAAVVAPPPTPPTPSEASPAGAPPAAPTGAPPPAPALGGGHARASAPVADEAPRARPFGPPRYDYLRFGAGFRIGYIDDPAFDTFASNDVLAQLSLDASYAFFTRGKLAIAAGAAWDIGSRTSGSRGITTRLTVHRLTVPIEARWYFAPWLDVFAKVAPGAGAYYARVEDPSSPATLEHAPWVFATDLSAGATVLLAGSKNHASRRARLWVNSEIGYGITSSRSLRPSPNRDEEDVLGSDQATRLGSLALNGVFWRMGLAVSF